MRVAIIGAGAAGCFASICIKRNMPDAVIDVYEAGPKPLAKVAITGGGRCNLTNSFRDVTNLSLVYPRGEKLMKRALKAFSHSDIMNWFENEGVALYTQEDQRVFPFSQNAMEIVNTLTRIMREEGITLHLSCRPTVSKTNNEFSVNNTEYNKLLITIGGCPQESKLGFLSDFNLDIVPPVPSLFTFNVAGEWHQTLMGTVVDNTVVSIAGTKLRSQGSLLLTHWGMSGPAILRLSSYAARWLEEHDYKCHICVNWYGDCNEEQVRQMLQKLMSNEGQKLVTKAFPRQFTQKHWLNIIERCNIPTSLRWQAMNKKEFNRLTTFLTADTYEVTGKGNFKEEFVTAGGVALNNINISTLESKNHPGLFFAGEVLDVDAITGGFNLQAAWSMAWTAAKEITRGDKD